MKSLLHSIIYEYFSSEFLLIVVFRIHDQPGFRDFVRLIFPVMEKEIRNGQFLILGSAEPELLRQSSESLAGRIAYLDLTPFFFRSCRPRERTILGGSGLEADSPEVTSPRTPTPVSNGGRTLFEPFLRWKTFSQLQAIASLPFTEEARVQKST
jgi:hypothetical protein